MVSSISTLMMKNSGASSTMPNRARRKSNMRFKCLEVEVEAEVEAEIEAEVKVKVEVKVECERKSLGQRLR